MKIAIVHHQYCKKGGMERYLFDLLSGFDDEADQIDLYVYQLDKSLPVPKNVKIKCFQLRWLPRKLRKYIFACRMSRINLQDYDLSISLTRTWGHGIAICGGSHRAYLDDLQKKRTLWQKPILWLENKGFTEADYIIAHSDKIRQDIFRLYPKKISLKVKKLYPPINIAKFNQSHKNHQATLKQAFGCNVSKVTLVTVSTGHKRKGVFELIEAMQLLPAEQFELLIAGSVLPENHLKDAGNIKQLGFVDDIEKLYAAADLMVLASHSEPFGLVVVEALACGTPVVISNKVGAKELVEEQSGVVIEQVTAVTIAEAIAEAVTKKLIVSKDFSLQNQLSCEQHVAFIKQLSHLKNEI